MADFGASVITGENSAIYGGTNCWAGEIFSESAAGVAGANSGVAANVAVTALPASPTGAQIQAYADARATNSARAVERQVNRPSWVCTDEAARPARHYQFGLANRFRLTGTI